MDLTPLFGLLGGFGAGASSFAAGQEQARKDAFERQRLAIEQQRADQAMELQRNTLAQSESHFQQSNPALLAQQARDYAIKQGGSAAASLAAPYAPPDPNIQGPSTLPSGVPLAAAPAPAMPDRILALIGLLKSGLVEKPGEIVSQNFPPPKLERVKDAQGNEYLQPTDQLTGAPVGERQYAGPSDMVAFLNGLKERGINPGGGGAPSAVPGGVPQSTTTKFGMTGGKPNFESTTAPTGGYATMAEAMDAMKQAPVGSNPTLKQDPAGRGWLVGFEPKPQGTQGEAYVQAVNDYQEKLATLGPAHPQTVRAQRQVDLLKPLIVGPGAQVLSPSGGTGQTVPPVTTPAERELAAAKDSSLGLIQNIRDLYDPTFVGPGRESAASFGSKMPFGQSLGLPGTSEKEVAFRKAVENYQVKANREFTQRFGPQEFSIIKNVMPATNQAPNMFLAALDQSEANIKRLTEAEARQRVGAGLKPLPTPGANTSGVIVQPDMPKQAPPPGKVWIRAPDGVWGAWDARQPVPAGYIR